MTVNPKKKVRIVKGDRYDLTKDPSTVKSVFSLGDKERK